MKRLTTRKANEMVEGGLIRQTKQINLEGIPEVDCVRDCERVIERTTQDLLQISPDYYRIGSYLNIKRTNCWTHQISVFYYQDSRGEERKWPQ